MKIKVKEKKGGPGKIAFSISGEMTIYTAGELKDFFMDLKGDGDVEVDCSGIEKIDTAGFQIFHLARKFLASSGRNMEYVNLSDEAVRIFGLYCEKYQ